jgi:hypothetical protein
MTAVVGLGLYERLCSLENSRLALGGNRAQLIKAGAALKICIVIANANEALPMGGHSEASLGIMHPLSPQRQGRRGFIIRRSVCSRIQLQQSMNQGPCSQ